MEFNGTKKLKEFNQGDIIDDLIEDLKREHLTKISARQIQFIKNGFCYALSLEWLRVAQINDIPYIPAITMIEKGAAFLANREKKDYAYFKQIANNFVTYAESFDKGKLNPEDFLSAPTNLETLREKDRYFLEMGTRKAITLAEGYYITNSDKAISLLKNTLYKYYFFGFYFDNKITKKVSGHRVAFARLEGKLYLFDPNAGLFEVNDVETLIDVFKTNYFNHQAMSFNVSACK